MTETTNPNEPEQIESSVDAIYRHRFPKEMLENRRQVWQILCREWFGRFIPPNASVLEVAPGYCEFINNIAASEKVGVDLNPETRQHANPDVTIHLASADTIADLLPRSHFDAAFMSNFLEHCRSRDQMLAVLKGCAAVLKPGGRVLILGPNFRYSYKEYYDYFDHHLALTEKAVAEALLLAGFTLERVDPRTLPFTFRSRLPSWPWMVRLYLKLPILWRLFGAQFFLVGRKP